MPQACASATPLRRSCLRGTRGRRRDRPCRAQHVASHLWGVMRVASCVTRDRRAGSPRTLTRARLRTSRAHSRSRSRAYRTRMAGVAADRIACPHAIHRTPARALFLSASLNAAECLLQSLRRGARRRATASHFVSATRCNLRTTTLLCVMLVDRQSTRRTNVLAGLSQTGLRKIRRTPVQQARAGKSRRAGAEEAP